MDNNSIVDQKHWDIGYENQALGIVSKNDPIRELITRYIPRGWGNSCIEIGAYPCRFLGIFGELGYELNGIDTTEKIESDELKKWIEQNNWNFKLLQKKNFLEFDPKNTFNIVCSFGFIEHFKNWSEIIMRHTMLLEIGGYLIIETPNFAGFFQRIFHVLVDYDNYKRHVIESMNPRKWAVVLGKDYEIIYIGYFGKFTFWFENSQINILQKIIIKCFKYMGRILRKLPCCRLYSPFCGLIAKKLS
jgi:2-polyprenyl-3-methyl-5-hydroxy-6-metoxy-1,4-benzoquinol methylase